MPARLGESMIFLQGFLKSPGISGHHPGITRASPGHHPGITGHHPGITGHHPGIPCELHKVLIA
jgi:hypothetical protein